MACTNPDKKVQIKKKKYVKGKRGPSRTGRFLVINSNGPDEGKKNVQLPKPAESKVDHSNFPKH